MVHGIRHEPDELEKEHCSSLFSHSSSILQYSTLRLRVAVLKLFRRQVLNPEKPERV
jgi:hypothetical protein